MNPRLPEPRGPLTEKLCDRLVGTGGASTRWTVPDEHPLSGEDTQLALHILYGLHYDGFRGVSDAWEWDPGLLALRGQLEERFVSALVTQTARRGVQPGSAPVGSEVFPEVRSLLEEDDGSSLSRFMADEGTRGNLREFVIHRSIYQRKEADPHTWAIPRLRGRAKSAMVTLQADEYGGGVPGRSHADLFAHTMLALDLDPAPGAYIDQVPGTTLATDNLISLFGLHRRWRGALVGHLAAFEMTSVIPMTRYAEAVRRLVDDGEAAQFYDVHVVADVEHAVIAADGLILGLTESDPEASADITFGVAALIEVESRLTGHLLGSWTRGSSSLRAAAMSPGNSFSGHEASFLEVLCLEVDPDVLVGAVSTS
jgi:hypothetical protein